MRLVLNSFNNKLAFLDLELFHYENTICAQNYTKSTSGNSYLHFNSCHHPRWVKNIPKSQFCRLKHNCTRLQDYETHGLLLKAKFKDKGYPDHIIEDAFQYYLSENAKDKRQTSTDDTTQPVRFVTQYHNRFKQMEKIFTKHWSILREDPHLKPTISDKPLVTYRRAKNIKAQIAPSKVKTARPTVSAPLTFFNIKGMYQCRKPLCLTCAHVTHRQKDFHHKGKLYVIPDFFNCGSDYVVYCLTCPCGLLYVGRTIRPLRKRFGEHRNLVEKGIDKHSVPRHFKEHHGQTSSGLRVWVIESIPPTLPTAERYKRLCERENYWIYTLDTLSPGGLNEGIEINILL